MKNEIAIRKPVDAISLADNKLWKNRFEIHSETSSRIYIIAQNKKSDKWGCSCMSYLTRRRCKHLTIGCGLSESQIHGNGEIAPMPTRRKLGNG